MLLVQKLSKQSQANAATAKEMARNNLIELKDTIAQAASSRGVDTLNDPQNAINELLAKL
jgi:hypothetical protein